MLGFRTRWKEPNSMFSHACSEPVCMVRPLQRFLGFSAGCSETLVEPSTLLGNLFGAPAQPHGGHGHKTHPPHQNPASRKRRCADSMPALRRCPLPLAIPPHPVLIACGGLTLAGRQVPTKAALSLPLLSWTGEGKYNERLVSRGKDREITQQLLSRAKQTRLGGKKLV